MLVRLGKFIAKGSTGSQPAAIRLSASSIAENASIGATIGVLSVENGSGTYTFTETADPDTKFTVSGSNLNTSAALDYETATSHSVTIQADNGVDTPLTRTFVILVTDVSEGGGGGSAGEPIGLLLILTKAA